MNYTAKIKDVKQVEGWWILFLDDGRTAGIPLIVEEPQRGTNIVIHYRILVPEGSAVQRMGDHGEMIHDGNAEIRYVEKIEFRGVMIDCEMFDQFLNERDRLRAANIALRQAAGYGDIGDGAFTRLPSPSLRSRVKAALRSLLDE